LIEIFAEIEALKDGRRPVTAAELTREKEGSILSLPGAFATGAQALHMYRDLVYYSRPLDFYNTYVDKVSAVNREQLMESARKHLHPQQARVLVVGDAHAPLIVRGDSDKDVPLLDAKRSPVQLLAGLKELLASGALGGKGKLVQLDADGKVL